MCDRDYDSVTGAMNDYICDWCQEEEENSCCCEYAYERDGRYLDWECESCYRKRPVPADAEPWSTETSTIRGYLSTFSLCDTLEERIEVLRSLFEYLLTIGPFFKAFPSFHAACVAKVAEFKTEPLAAPIHDVLLATEAFLAG